MSETAESRWFKVIVFIFSGIFAGLSLANIIYYNRIRKSGTDVLSPAESTSMLIINIILFIISIVIFIWALWRLLFSKSYREEITEKTVEYLKAPGYGLSPPGAKEVDVKKVTYVGGQPVSTTEKIIIAPQQSGSGKPSSSVFGGSSYSQSQSLNPTLQV